jgi:phage baseplate assembly protein W
VTDRLSGLAFPFRLKDGSVRRAEGFDKVQDDVRHLLSTRLGERTMLRGYGGGVHHRVEDPNDETLAALVRHEIATALRSFMPDVQLTGPITTETAGHELVVRLEYSADPTAVVRRLEIALPVGQVPR